MWLEGREGGRIVLFTIHPFLFYIVPKKNRRTNTFLNKGRALEAEAHWGHKRAPLRVRTERSHNATELPTPPALLSHLPEQNGPSTRALIRGDGRRRSFVFWGTLSPRRLCSISVTDSNTERLSLDMRKG